METLKEGKTSYKSYNRKYWLYWAIALIIICAMAYYPIRMGLKVTGDMARQGFVLQEDYPKYVIPYTPIACAVLAAVLLMPVIQRVFKKHGLLAALMLAGAIFLTLELLMETKILVQTKELKTQLESWQLALCYIPPEQYETRVWQAVDVLLGGYSQWFKLHFYLISAVIIAAVLNSVYGFGRMIRTGDKTRKTALIMQTAAGLMFLGMCIWACFTAFYRTGELTVSPVSAVLMALFFIIMGVTVGLFVGSFTLNKGRFSAVWLPALCAAGAALLMYVGELMLLHGELYRFGEGFVFKGLPFISLAPVDIAVILAAGAVTALLCGIASKANAD